MSHERSDSDSDSDSDGGGISLTEGLSAEALAALFSFVVTPAGDGDQAPSSCVTSDNMMSDKIGQHLDQTKGDPTRTAMTALKVSDPADALDDLESRGVIRLNGVLSAEFCDKCLAETNRLLLVSQLGGTDHFVESRATGFGNVDASTKRWDMFLPHVGCFYDAMTSMLGKSTPLTNLFEALFEGSDAEFFEYAALVSDSGSLSQRIHSDTTHQTRCPVYTVFIALQDITKAMGPTLFIPGSHDKAHHEQFRRNKHQWLTEANYEEGTLSRGDVVVMDSRTFHCGSANDSSQRRALLYFSLLNPLTTSMGGGSIFENMSSLSLRSLLKACAADSEKKL